METSGSPTQTQQERIGDDTLRSEIYEIRVKGRLDCRRWADHFEGMELQAGENESTILRGPISDQAAMYGLLSQLRNLNLPLLSVNPVDRSDK